MDTLDIFQSESQEGDDEYEVELTAAEVLQSVEEAWLNEKHCPEILESKMDIMECMLEQMQTMEGNLNGLKKGDIRLPIHRMELSRIRFMINSYLRLRLNKIQKHLFYYTRPDSEENNRRLTPEEVDFAAAYKENLLEHFGSLVLRHIPGTWDAEKSVPALPGPRLNSAVFIEVKEDFPGLEVFDESGGGKDESVDLKVGDQHLMKYGAVASLVQDGKVRLI